MPLAPRLVEADLSEKPTSETVHDTYNNLYVTIHALASMPLATVEPCLYSLLEAVV